jgi:hypothetical protein
MQPVWRMQALAKSSANRTRADDPTYGPLNARLTTIPSAHCRSTSVTAPPVASRAARVHRPHCARCSAIWCSACGQRRRWTSASGHAAGRSTAAGSAAMYARCCMALPASLSCGGAAHMGAACFGLMLWQQQGAHGHAICARLLAAMLAHRRRLRTFDSAPSERSCSSLSASLSVSGAAFHAAASHQSGKGHAAAVAVQMAAGRGTDATAEPLPMLAAARRPRSPAARLMLGPQRIEAMYEEHAGGPWP